MSTYAEENAKAQAMLERIAVAFEKMASALEVLTKKDLLIHVNVINPTSGVVGGGYGGGRGGHIIPTAGGAGPPGDPGDGHGRP